MQAFLAAVAAALRARDLPAARHAGDLLAGAAQRADASLEQPRFIPPFLDIADVVAFLTNEKPAMTHVVLTGRNAAGDLIEIADLVTEMELVKHPFRGGIKAQIGVEF